MASPCHHEMEKKKGKEDGEEQNKKEEICSPLILKRFPGDGKYVIANKQDNSIE